MLRAALESDCRRSLAKSRSLCSYPLNPVIEPKANIEADSLSQAQGHSVCLRKCFYWNLTVKVDHFVEHLRRPI
jgi:hypothetical protein